MSRLLGLIELKSVIKLLIFGAIVGILFFARAAYIANDPGELDFGGSLDAWYFKPPAAFEKPAVCYRLQKGDVDSDALVGRWVKAKNWNADGTSEPCLIPETEDYYRLNADDQPDGTQTPYPCDDGVITSLPVCKTGNRHSASGGYWNEPLSCVLVSGGGSNTGRLGELGGTFGPDQSDPECRCSDAWWAEHSRESPTGKDWECCFEDHGLQAEATGTPLVLAGCRTENGSVCMGRTGGAAADDVYNWFCRVQDKQRGDTNDDVQWRGTGDLTSDSDPWRATDTVLEGNMACTANARPNFEWGRNTTREVYSSNLPPIEECKPQDMLYDRGTPKFVSSKA